MKQEIREKFLSLSHGLDSNLKEQAIGRSLAQVQRFGGILSSSIEAKKAILPIALLEQMNDHLSVLLELKDRAESNDLNDAAREEMNKILEAIREDFSIWESMFQETLSVGSAWPGGKSAISYPVLVPVEVEVIQAGMLSQDRVVKYGKPARQQETAKVLGLSSPATGNIPVGTYIIWIEENGNEISSSRERIWPLGKGLRAHELKLLIE